MSKPCRQPKGIHSLFQKAIRLNPIGPADLYREFGYSLRDVGRFEEAVSAFKKAIQLAPYDMNAQTGLAVTYSMMGREKEARAQAAEILRINPKFSVDAWANKSSYKDQSQREKIAEGLREAGLK